MWSGLYPQLQPPALDVHRLIAGEPPHSATGLCMGMESKFRAWYPREFMVAILLLLTTAVLSLSGAVNTERVFGPETATGPYKHPACLTELDNGDLYLVYYGGGGEYAEATAVFGSRKRKGEARWSAPVKIAGDPFRSLGNAVIWQARLGPALTGSRFCR